MRYRNAQAYEREYFATLRLWVLKSAGRMAVVEETKVEEYTRAARGGRHLADVLAPSKRAALRHAIEFVLGDA